MLNTKRFVETCLPLLRRSWEVIMDVHLKGKKIPDVDAKGEQPEKTNQPSWSKDDVKWKSETDPVTIADFTAQYVIWKGIHDQFPDLTIIGEESPENMIVSEFDFSLCVSTKMDAPTFENLEYPIADCCVWIDPLDGTQNFVKGQLENVTVLIGLAVKGVPKIGLICTGFSEDSNGKLDTSCLKPRLFVGDTSVSNVFVYSLPSYTESSLLHTYAPFEPYELETKKKWVITTSQNHFSPKVANLFAFFDGEVVLDQTSGCGYKYFNIINGNFDCYLQDISGASKWDTITGEALLECLGGVNTDVRGVKYHYGSDAQHVNGGGAFALNNRKVHAVIAERINKYFESQD
jgi:3'(2'), 5'-bisphosphate nucleotidase